MRCFSISVWRTKARYESGHLNFTIAYLYLIHMLVIQAE
jgi:hypothetical protein